MKTTTELIEIIESKDIIYETLNLPDQLLGYYQESSSGTYILMNAKINEDSDLFKCVLAEEVGHYYTTSGINEPKKYNTYHQKLAVDKQEEKAIKWACDYLIPTKSLLNYLADNIDARLTDLIQHFSVTETFMVQKLNFMAKLRAYWPIKGTYYLCLSNLPSIYIANIFDESLINVLET